MAVNLADENPDFMDRLSKLRAALQSAGIDTSIVSGYRSTDLQNQLYQNHLAKIAGQPLPYPNQEAPSVVAAPGRSYHNYGMAADLSTKNQADYAKIASMAGQYGLEGIGPSDPGHIQMAGFKIPGTTLNSAGTASTGLQGQPNATNPPTSLTPFNQPAGTQIGSMAQPNTAATPANVTQTPLQKGLNGLQGIAGDLQSHPNQIEPMQAPNLQIHQPQMGMSMGMGMGMSGMGASQIAPYLVQRRTPGLSLGGSGLFDGSYGA